MSAIIWRTGRDGAIAGAEVIPQPGNSDPNRICTSHVERQNLTIRMPICRLTLLTNAFSKKWENFWAALSLHFACYNFCPIPKAFASLPRWESDIADHVWRIEELLK
jgi:hypothetical protein